MFKDHDRRTLVCLAVHTVVWAVPCLGLWYGFTLPLRLQQQWNLDPEPGQAEKLRVTFEFTSVLVAILGTAIFSISQLQRLHPVVRKGYAEWLAATGWNGRRRCLPIDPSKPYVELPGVLLVAMLMAIISRPGSVSILLTWLIVRMSFIGYSMRSFLKLPEIAGALLLPGLALLTFDAGPVPYAVLLTAIVLFERAHGAALDRWGAGEIISETHSVTTDRIWPLAQLSLPVVDRRLRIVKAVGVAFIIGWSAFCLTVTGTNLAAASGSFLDEPVPGIAILFPWTLVMLAVLAKQLQIYRASVCWTMPGLFTRFTSLRWFVPSWDRALVPMLIGYAVVVLTAFFGPEWLPARVALAAFCHAVITLHPFVDPVAWELTSSAQLINPNLTLQRQATPR